MVFLLVYVKGRENFGDFEPSFLEFREYGTGLEGNPRKRPRRGVQVDFCRAKAGEMSGKGAECRRSG